MNCPRKEKSSSVSYTVSPACIITSTKLKTGINNKIWQEIWQAFHLAQTQTYVPKFSEEVSIFY